MPGRHTWSYGGTLESLPARQIQFLFSIRVLTSDSISFNPNWIARAGTEVLRIFPTWAGTEMFVGFWIAKLGVFKR